MRWISSYNLTTDNLHWQFDPVSSSFIRTTENPTILASLKYVASNFTFRIGKSYIYETIVKNFTDEGGNTNNKLRVITPYTSVGQQYYPFFSLIPSNKVVDGATYSANFATPEQRSVPIESDGSTFSLFYIASPRQQVTSNSKLTYYATYDNFYRSAITAGHSQLIGINVYETDWKFQGYALGKLKYGTTTGPYAGWYYDVNTSNLIYNHPKANTTTTGSGSKNRRLPLDKNFATNYVARFVNYDNYNVSLNVQITPNPATTATFSYLSLYLSTNLPPNTTNYSNFINSLNYSGQYLGKIQEDGVHNFYNLQGDSYIIIVSSNVEQLGGLASGGYTIEISNVEIDGSYSEPDNNVERLFTNTDNFQEPEPLSVIGVSPEADFNYTQITSNTQHIWDGPSGVIAAGATGAISNPDLGFRIRGVREVAGRTPGINYTGFFSDIYGTVSNLQILTSKMGNGKFKAGIWENGVWNNGIRIDENCYDFDNVVTAFNLSTVNKKWRIQIYGSTQSASNFEIGDKVSIGNIVGIDINENRKLFKNYFTVVRKDDNNIIVEVENNFPIRRIEKDSEDHKIKISKNVWLNGGFLNGYWENGIWNDGLFKGYPIITEMYDSHWIDGKFDGGHFYGEQPRFRFIDTNYIDGNVGLTFGSVSHGFIVGDIVIIDKDDKTINATYDGEAVVEEVIDDHLIKLNIPWGVSTPSGTEGGIIYRKTKTSVIQNFEFKDNNVAKYNLNNIKSGDTTYYYSTSDVQRIWRFNSWIDVVYSTQSYTTIGRNQFSHNPIADNEIEAYYEQKYGIVEYADTNLRGGITTDVLSSKSLFRDIDSQISRYYSLGTKYDIYQDFIGDASDFELPFNTEPNLGGMSNFINQGWTYSITDPYLGLNSVVSFFDNAWDDGKVGFATYTYSRIAVGDKVYIQQYPGATNPEYDGYSTITKISYVNTSGQPTTWYYITDKDFLISTTAQGGIMRYGSRPEKGPTISRTIDATLKIEGPQNVTQTLVLKNSQIDIAKRRYSILEYDVNYLQTGTYSTLQYNPVKNLDFIYLPDQPDGLRSNIIAFPDQTTKEGEIGTFTNYYYNRLNLDLGIINFSGYTIMDLQEYEGDTITYPTGYTIDEVYQPVGNSTVELDNIKFYEVDAIPFFKYTTEDYINKSIQIPLIGVAPFIDYSNENFSFVDSIRIGSDSIELNSNVLVNSMTQLASISFDSNDATS